MRTIDFGEAAPYGLFKRSHEPQFTCLRLPLFPWYGKAYQGADDSYVTGWHLRDLFVKFACGDNVLSEHSRADWMTEHAIDG